MKKQIFASALRRVNARLEQVSSEARRARTTGLLREALAGLATPPDFRVPEFGEAVVI